MSRKKGITFSAEQKSKIALEMLKEDQSLAELAIKYQVTTQTLGSGKKQFSQNAALAFEPAKALQEHKAEPSKLQHENDELAKKLGKTTIERDWLKKKLKSLDLSDRKDLVQPKLEDLSLTRQCALLHVSRRAHYYKRVLMSETGLKIMHTIDEIATDNSEYGYRFIHQELIQRGFLIGRDRVLK